MLTTDNACYGFYGTIHGDKDEAWNAAMTAVMAETGHDEEAVREFLDSNCGRHFADQVNDRFEGNNIEQAIRSVLETYRHAKLSRRQRIDWKVPAGLSYLDGLIWAVAVV